MQAPLVLAINVTHAFIMCNHLLQWEQNFFEDHHDLFEFRSRFCMAII